MGEGREGLYPNESRSGQLTDKRAASQSGPGLAAPVDRCGASGGGTARPGFPRAAPTVQTMCVCRCCNPSVWPPKVPGMRGFTLSACQRYEIRFVREMCGTLGVGRPWLRSDRNGGEDGSTVPTSGSDNADEPRMYPRAPCWLTAPIPIQGKPQADIVVCARGLRSLISVAPPCPTTHREGHSSSHKNSNPRT